MSYNVHDRLKDKNVEELKLIADSDRMYYSICLMNLEHDLNIGNCIRTAHLMGCDTVYLFGRRRYDLRSTVGANHYQNIVKFEVEDIEDNQQIHDRFCEMVETNNLVPLLIDMTDRSKSLEKMAEIVSVVTDFYNPYRKQPLLVFGNEQAGIPESIKNTFFNHFHINQRGVMRSLNVASAAAIAMYEISGILQKYANYN
jgi:tRNA G18 (ribose-2'-O)-methylase SpoU